MPEWTANLFPEYRDPRLHRVAQTGDALITEGVVPWWKLITWPPMEIIKRFTLRQVYHLIRKYQKQLGRKHYQATHVRACIGDDKFIEATWPRVRVGRFAELSGKKIHVCRPQLPFFAPNFKAALMEAVDTTYDIGELLEHADGWTDLDDLIDFDDGKRYVCSSLYAYGLNQAGGSLGRNWEMTDPAWMRQPGAPFACYTIKSVKP